MLDHHMIIVKIFKSAYTAPRGVLQLPAAGDPFVDLHCVALEEYDPVAQTFRFWNNWGSGWGDRGYGTMTLEYADEFFHEGWIYRPARWGLIPAKRERLAADTVDRVHLRQLWSVENPRVVGRLPGLGRDHNAKWQWYETMSPTLDSAVACIEVRNGFGLRMGWAFLRKISDCTAEITELLVWPTFRHAHIGSWLEIACHAQAATWGVQELHLIINETDSVVGPIRHAARHFADARGYSARWRTRTAPRSNATYIKPVELP
jgi:GNAT superfamily N-acetyltransferase